MKLLKLSVAVLMLFVTVPSAQAERERLYQPVSISVDFTKTLPQLIADGGYDGVCPNINVGDFTLEPGSGVRQFDVLMFELPEHSKEILTTEQVLARMDAAGLRPATFRELLAVGVRKLYGEYEIVALGNLVQEKGEFWTPCLHGKGSKRILCNGRYSRDWTKKHTFAAVRK